MTEKKDVEKRVPLEAKELSEFVNPDLQILDRYTSYSAELLRIASAEILFLVGLFAPVFNGNAILKAGDDLLKTGLGAGIFAVGICCLSVSVLSCLSQRLFALDGMHYHVTWLRKGEPTYENHRNYAWRMCDLFLAAAFWLLSLGTLAVGAIIASLYFADALEGVVGVSVCIFIVMAVVGVRYHNRVGRKHLTQTTTDDGSVPPG